MKKHTDNELLRLAFKAWLPNENYIRMVNDAGGDYWNPLKDDGQALRLAIKLDFAICVELERKNIRIDGPSPFGLELVNEKIIQDPYAATRRAIVRAAAEIGANL